MHAKCVCGEFHEVDMKYAGKRYRCEKCGRYFTIPDTVLAQMRAKSLIATGPAINSAIVVQPIQEKPVPKILLWTAGVVVVTFVIAAALLVSSIGPRNTTDIAQADTPGNTTKNASAAATAPATVKTFGDPSHPGDSVPEMGTEFYRQKAPIDMTETEWVLTLQEWGELPDWWSKWPYSQAHPWSYPLQTQIMFFRHLQEADQHEPVSAVRLDALRKEFLSTQRDYEPYPANSPNNAVDRFLGAARTSLSRELMEQQLGEAATILHSLLRPSPRVEDHAGSPPRATAFSK